MKLFAIPNMAVNTAEPIEITPDELPNVTRPNFDTKEDYRKWCLDKNTCHCFVTGMEGVQANVRVAKANEPVKTWAFIAEYDAEPPEDWIERLRKAEIPPTYACKSFSGNARCFWELEAPVGYVNGRLHDALMKIVWKEVKALKLLPGFQADESCRIGQYFEIGTDWVVVAGTLSSPLVEGWMARAHSKVDWKKEGTSVPVDKIREEGEKRYPGAWPGGWNNFEYGQRGVRFWAGGDASSVIAVPTGCVCFTGDTPFVPWTSIFGQDWVRRATDAMLGEASNGMYYDTGGRRYWVDGKITGVWIPVGAEDVRMRLAERGLSTVGVKGVLSEADAAKLYIQRAYAVDGVFPAFHRREELINVNGHKYLNITRVALVKPDESKHEWGEGFEWTADFLMKLFGETQLRYYITWLAHFYQSCLRGDPERGLAMFIAGPTGCGKTFLSNVILRCIFGGAGEATRYLTGEDQFNEHLFGCPIWTVDDAVATVENRANNKFSQIIKAVTANDSFVMRGMFKAGLTLPWSGRVVVTMNDDPESLRMLPSTEVSLMDKIMLLRAGATFDKFPDNDLVRAELPAFCAFLRDLERDPEIWIGGRFGVAAHHDPKLLDEAKVTEATQSAAELIECWAKEHFASEGRGAKDDDWVGTPTELVLEISRYDSLSTILKVANSPVTMGRYLAKLINRGEKGVKVAKKTRGRRYYRITRAVLPEGWGKAEG